MTETIPGGVGGNAGTIRSMEWQKRIWLALIVVLTLAVSALLSAQAFAAAPPAGSIIGNQATASYVDVGGNARTTTSNLVETNILQVAGVDVESDQNKVAAPSSTIYLPHTVTNTGNGNDIYDLVAAQVAGGGFAFGSITVYADADGDGVPDNFDALAVTPTLPAGGSYNVVIAAQVPAGALAAQASQLTLTATSQYTGSVTDTNTDTVTVSGDVAVVPVTKALSLQSGPVGSEVEVTLTYTNNGTRAATDLTLTDLLDNRYEYVAGTGRWSVSGTGTALTDDNSADPAGIAYEVSGQSVAAVIASVAPGQSGWVRFKARIKAATAPGLVPNKATVAYGNGATTVSDETNISNFTVTQSAAVKLSDESSSSDSDGNQNDVVSSAAVPQGSTLTFDNVVVNQGNGVDTFDITYSNVSFPAGTSFQLRGADGTPLTDSNGNGIPDSGPLAPGASFHVHLRVILPNSAAGSGPFDVTKTATSQVNPSVKDSVTDRLLAITANSVDLTNDSAGAGAPGAGVQPTGEAAAVTTNSVKPGQTTAFTLFVNNNSAVLDSYNLAASTNNTFAALSLPAGWSVTFRNAATGAVISNTGTIAAGASLRITAEVAVPAGATPGTTSLFFRALSPTSGALDVKHDAVTVDQVVDLSVTPNNTSQVFAGGQVVYSHTLNNNGNVGVSAAALSNSDSAALWSSLIWYDLDGNGAIGAGDVRVDNVDDILAANPALGATLAPGAQVPLLIQVFAPSGANNGAANTTSVGVSAVGDADATNNQATDTSIVVSGDVQVIKRQALDATCDGTADGSFTATGRLDARPGACLIYEVTLRNLGTQPISAASISDTTPTFTSYVGNSAVTVPAGNVNSAPANGASGQVVANFTSVASGSSAVLTFRVKIDQ
ncbi:DUF11 domain-containing protein [Pseudomonas sp. A-1]|uniref:beta strand repeat-containing protein n=1 Tax=Pseudomonas sp. A-1 TaxID=1821274 RepID=UPI0010A5DEA8|nr:DUF11 domain-containing protein [Pseudomonas sp. A-1]THG82227.1 DUF11 domain-containing protein [Pseudomonas sp. A-1]